MPPPSSRSRSTRGGWSPSRRAWPAPPPRRPPPPSSPPPLARAAPSRRRRTPDRRPPRAALWAAAQAPPPQPRPSPSAARAPAQCPPPRAAASLSGSRSPSAHSATGCGSSLRSVRRRSSTRRATWSWRWWARSGRSRSCSAGRRTARRSRGSRAGASALYPSRREGLPPPLPVCCLRAAVPRFLVSVGHLQSIRGPLYARANRTFAA